MIHIEPYTAGNGLNLVSNSFSVKVDDESEEFLSVGTNGVKLSGVQTAIDTALQSAKDYADGKEHKNTTYDISALGVTVTLTPSEGEAKAVTLDAYTKSETDTAIADAVKSATGGESASDVLIALNNYKKAVNAEVWGNSDISDEALSGTASRIDTAETKLSGIEDGAQVNVIESVVAATDAKITATKSGKTVTIDDSALRTDIAAAKKAGDDAVTILVLALLRLLKLLMIAKSKTYKMLMLPQMVKFRLLKQL